jgi:hypothetical protein
MVQNPRATSGGAVTTSVSEGMKAGSNYQNPDLGRDMWNGLLERSPHFGGGTQLSVCDNTRRILGE